MEFLAWKWIHRSAVTSWIMHAQCHCSVFCSDQLKCQTLFSFAHLGDGKTLGLLTNVTDYSHNTGFWSCWIKSSTLDLMVGLKSSANNNQCFSIQSNRILGQFCSSPITANLVCCDWLKIRTYPKIISATINSRRPNTCDPQLTQKTPSPADDSASVGVDFKEGWALRLLKSVNKSNQEIEVNKLKHSLDERRKPRLVQKSNLMWYTQTCLLFSKYPYIL